MNPVVALFVRSLRQDSKSLYSHLLRCGLGLFVLFWIWQATRDGWFRSAPGREVFSTISMINVWFITVASVGYFATSITEEKEEKTLGLMQMAGISPLGLLLGKSISRLWLALVLIAIQLPFTLLSVTMGGVTLRQVFATYVALAGYTFFLSGVATFISVVSRRSYSAVCGMFAFLILFFLMSSISGLLVQFIGNLNMVWLEDWVVFAMDWVNATDIWERVSLVLTISFDEPIVERHFIASIVGGSVFFFFAWLTFGFFANRHVDSSASPVGRLMRRIVLPKPRAWHTGPLVWKDFFFGCGGGTGWLVRCLLIVVTACLFAIPFAGFGSPRGRWAELVGGLLIAASLTFAALDATVQSIRFLSTEQSDKTLQMLGMLPRSAASILYSKFFGYLFCLVPSLLAFLFGLVLVTSNDDFWFGGRWYAEEVLGFSYSFLLIFVFLHLNVLLSTYIKWGAAPASFGILLMLNVCCFTTMAMGGGPRGSASAFLFVLNVLAMGGIIGLQVMIGSRFRELVGR